MPKFIDLTGKVFGRLTVLGKSEDDSNYIYWKCVCECGNIKNVRGSHLRYGEIKSCGCLAKEYIIKRNMTHGCSYSREYKIWAGMKNRCLNKNSSDYKYYGAKGITVCDRWKDSFEIFLEDMGKCPKGYSLDRIDNDKGYSFDNCRWATEKEQKRNRSNSYFLICKDRVMILADWAKELKIRPAMIIYRLKQGMLFENIVKLYELKKERGGERIYLHKNKNILD